MSAHAAAADWSARQPTDWTWAQHFHHRFPAVAGEWLEAAEEYRTRRQQTIRAREIRSSAAKLRRELLGPWQRPEEALLVQRPPAEVHRERRPESRAPARERRPETRGPDVQEAEVRPRRPVEGRSSGSAAAWP